MVDGGRGCSWNSEEPLRMVEVVNRKMFSSEHHMAKFRLPGLPCLRNVSVATTCPCFYPLCHSLMLSTENTYCYDCVSLQDLSSRALNLTLFPTLLASNAMEQNCSAQGRASSARSTLSGPIDLLALATKTRSEAHK